MDRGKSSKLFKPTPIDNDALLPYEWPSSYFINKKVFYI